MKLSPLDIKKQEFAHGFRGYDTDEVDAFLDLLTQQWQQQQETERRLGDRVRELEAKLDHYEKVEEALQEALQTARESSHRVINNAEEKARLIIEDAEQRADRITKNAADDRHHLKRETAKIGNRRSEIVTRLRAFLMSELELLARYDGDDPIGFIKLLPAEERRFHENAPGALPFDERLEAPSSDEEAEEEATSWAPSPAQDEVSFDEDEALLETLEDVRAFEDPAETPRPAPTLQPERPQPQTQPSPQPQTQPSPQPAPLRAVKRQPHEDEAPPPAARYEGGGDEASLEDELGRPAWTVRPIFSAGAPQSGPTDEPDKPPRRPEKKDRNVSASAEEIEKIRRILSDLD